VWECAHLQLACPDAKYPFEQLQIVTRSESSRNIQRPPEADRGLGEAVAKLGVCLIREFSFAGFRCFGQSRASD
jgi:hypothetical protein